MQIVIEQIKVPTRVRKETGNLDALMESLSRVGQLNPITVTRDFELVAGFRRLSAAKRLNWKMIDALIVDGADEERRLAMELEENIHRKDFTPEELLEGWKRLDALRHPRLGARVKNAFKNIFAKIAFWHKPKREAAQAPGSSDDSSAARARIASSSLLPQSSASQASSSSSSSSTRSRAPVGDDSDQYGV